ncbi:MAG TPA: shikimate kinase [Pyrinomonadaceae bacterium]|nr:shikimate kinase [Pyrinomonadaceae bacterium]
MNDSPQRILITGFMAAGKTTVARSLARMLVCACVDLDDLVCRREGRRPHELIDEDGEDAFRDAETRALRSALERSDARAVIALGGGTWTLERNRALVARHKCFTVWLDAPFDLCWQRIASADSLPDRPLARDREQARKLYESRRALYQLADLRVVVTPERSADDIADDIAAGILQSARRNARSK